MVEQKDRDEIVENMPMVDTTVEEFIPIEGLTEENRELKGVLFSSKKIDKSTRPAFLKIQAHNFQDTINKTEERDDINNLERYVELEKRIIGLQEAKDKTLEQMQKGNVREQQEEDITRLQRFKKWAKENLIRLSAVAISIAGIITAIIISARKALVKGG